MSTHPPTVDLSETTQPTADVWAVLQTADRPMTRREIAAEIGVQPASVHDAVHDLIERGLVKVGHSLQNPRAQTLEATAPYRDPNRAHHTTTVTETSE